MFIGVEQNLSSVESGVISYCELFEWDFPVGQDTDGGSTIFAAYGTQRHNYMVIGKDGRIAYRATAGYNGNPSAWSTYKQGLINAIVAALAVPVEPTTWGRIKTLLN